jgi:hypothetical protein
MRWVLLQVALASVQRLVYQSHLAHTVGGKWRVLSDHSLAGAWMSVGTGCLLMHPANRGPDKEDQQDNPEGHNEQHHQG